MAAQPQLHKQITGVKSILQNQIDEIIARLETPYQDMPKLVHDTRTGCKRARAMLRLMRPEIGDALYRQENARFRDAARLLRDMRDARTGIKTLDKLYSRYQRQIPAPHYQWLRTQFEADYALICDEVLRQERTLDRVVDRAAFGRRYITELRPGKEKWSGAAAGLKHTYKQAYKAFDRAWDDPAAQNLHEWRKQTKYVMYQLELLAETSRPIKRLYKRFYKLADLLGDDHNLVMLCEKLQSEFPENEEGDIIWDVIAQRRKCLKKKALAMGKKVYKRKPKRFIRQVSAKLI